VFWEAKDLNINIEPLLNVSSADCVRLHKEGFLHAWSESEFETLLSSANITADGVFLSQSKRLIGYVLSRRVLDEAEILTIVMDQKYRNKKLATSLLQFHLESLIKQAIKRLFLEVAETNQAARKLYEGLDFSIIGERQGYYRSENGERLKAYVMSKNL
jgi:ribosomal-protein-alanine N-acetyltransferase